MSLQKLSESYRPTIETEIQKFLNDELVPENQELYSMLAYHMGWEGAGAGIEAQGKRIRPLMVLLSIQAAGGKWQDAIPAAIAVSLIHNFSLIHDDIEDNSDLRRGRPTVWKIWGIPQAVNAGDLMFTLANNAINRLEKKFTAEMTLNASKVLLSACKRLTKGQYLDLAFESIDVVSMDEYLEMISCKTAALLSCCNELGALIAGNDVGRQEAFREYGKNLGLAFQMKDDWLGIWGNSMLTGKSNESDLVSGKKTLPVIFGLEQKGEFAKKWLSGGITLEEVDSCVKLLTSEGAQEYTEQLTNDFYDKALTALDEAVIDKGNEAYTALQELTSLVIKRDH